LKRHILSFHENKRLYKCDVCGKSFKGHIRDHMRTHAEDKEDKPYGCHQCGARWPIFQIFILLFFMLGSFVDIQIVATNMYVCRH
jgi:DNA-directed RNA polymerase subunit RPC12/RpoP